MGSCICLPNKPVCAPLLGVHGCIQQSQGGFAMQGDVDERYDMLQAVAICRIDVEGDK